MAGTRRLLLAALLPALGVSITGCASLPQLHLSALAPKPGQTVAVVGPKGPLSPRRATALLRELGLQAPDADALQRHLAIEQAVAGTPLYTGNRTAILRDGYQTFPAMYAAIRNASHSLYLEYYIFEDIEWQGTRLDQLLTAKSASGVDVAVIYDSIGSLDTPGEFLSGLSAAGVRVLPFNPVNPLKAHHRWSLNDRDHRKILIADNQVAIVGGVNIASDYEHGSSAFPGSSHATPTDSKPYWRDTDVEIAGPAVTELSRLFREHWTQQGGAPLAAIDPAATAAQGDEVVHIVGSSPGASFVPRYYATVLSAINSAARTAWITASYFVPTHQEIVALARAARRGVDVRLLLPSHNDSAATLAVQRSSYGRLLKAGVRIYEMDGVILHSKSIVIDGVWSVVGSSNFDHRSVLFNDEVDAVVLGKSTALTLEQLFRADLEQGHAIDLASWQRRPFGERVREAFWNAFSTLL